MITLRVIPYQLKLATIKQNIYKKENASRKLYVHQLVLNNCDSLNQFRKSHL